MNRIHALLAASLIAVGAAILANAATRDEQSKACRLDAIHFCAVHIPNREKIIACMERHLDELSPRCRAMFTSDSRDEKDDKDGDQANPQ